LIVIAAGDIVLPDRLVRGGSLVVDGTRIVAIHAQPRTAPEGAVTIDARDRYVVPGFIDVHVHGIGGHDSLDPGDALDRIAARLPRYGVTAFCPTTVACAPDALARVLDQLRSARAAPAPGSARMLPAHLESNFINPDYAGAQPAGCLRLPPASQPSNASTDFSANDILAVIRAFRTEVGIVTLAPELPGGIDLLRSLVSAGHRVSLGHSAADFETANAAFDAGAAHATHLFNRMPPLGHRSPGLAGAVLAREDVAAELICDGFHVHPAIGRMAIATKGVAKMIAITDGTAGSGLPIGSSARLAGRPIHVRDQGAFLDDGTVAGSTVTMDRVFGTIVHGFRRSVVDAAVMCSTTPARELGLRDRGVIAEQAIADIVVLDRAFDVEKTFIEGREVYGRVTI
jgi:N-acetylglucosamine-6-phosphate deacetylase